MITNPTTNVASPCSECDGETVQFRGAGRELQYRICSRVEQAGHLNQEQIAQLITARRKAEARSAFPSGRWA